MTDSERIDRLAKISVRTSLHFLTEGVSDIPKYYTIRVGGDPL